MDNLWIVLLLLSMKDGMLSLRPYAVLKYSVGGPGSSVGIATELRAGRSGIESRWGRDFPPVQTGPAAHPSSCKMGTGSFPEVELAGAWG